MVRNARVDHITFVVSDLDRTTTALERVLGRPATPAISLTGMAVRTLRVGDAELHINTPRGAGPVADFLRARGPGIHHVAIAVDDLDVAIDVLAGRGVRTLGIPKDTAPGLREVFIDPASVDGVVLQLVERRGKAPLNQLDIAALERLLRDGTPDVTNGRR